MLTDRPQEYDVLLGLERLGRETVEELRSLVGILREPGHTDASTAPVPSLSRAEDLVADVRAAGLDVDLEVRGTPLELPRALDLSAYRILQEALTNVLRHAPGSRARVLVDWARDGVDLSVRDDGARDLRVAPGHRRAGDHGVGRPRHPRHARAGADVRRHPRGRAGRRRVRGAGPPAGPPDGGGRAMSDPIRIVLVDDEAMVRVGLRMVLSGEPDLEVVGEAADGAEAVDVVLETRPDVVLMDVRMPTVDGIEGSRRVLAAAPDVKVVVLTTFDEDDYVEAALRSGVSGFLLKVAPPERLIDGVRTVASGGGLLDPAVTVRVIESFASASPLRTRRAEVLDTLTERERDVLRLIGRGMSNAEIAAELYLGETTVKTHVSSLLAKLGLRDRVQAVVAAYETGHVRPGE